LDFAKATVPNLNFRGSYLQSRLSARQLQVAHTLSLSGGFRCNERAVLREARIGGQLDCEQAVFSNPDGDALTAEWLTVDGGMFLRKAQCTGKIQLHGGRIGGH
jgi:hypothetical protein